MSDKEIKSIVKSIRENGKRVASNKESAEAFLKKIGILNRDGKVKMVYRDICIPKDRA